MANGTVHEPQFMMMKIGLAAAGGGLIGAILGAFIVWWLLHCGCPCAVSGVV